MTTTSPFAGIDNITRVLSALSITPVASSVHNETNSPASWKEALGTSSVPVNLIKTLVYKPKTAKTAAPVPVVVIAREDTETSSSTLGKKLNLKELRLASEDLLTEFFSLDKNSRTSSIHQILLCTNVIRSLPACFDREKLFSRYHCRRCFH